MYNPTLLNIFKICLFLSVFFPGATHTDTDIYIHTHTFWSCIFCLESWALYFHLVLYQKYFYVIKYSSKNTVSVVVSWHDEGHSWAARWRDTEDEVWKELPAAGVPVLHPPWWMEHICAHNPEALYTSYCGDFREASSYKRHDRLLIPFLGPLQSPKNGQRPWWFWASNDSSGSLVTSAIPETTKSGLIRTKDIPLTQEFQQIQKFHVRCSCHSGN